MNERLQRTIGGEARWEGVGLHTGGKVRMRARGGAPGRGIVFECGGRRVRADVSSIVSGQRSTAISDGCVTIYTVEHILAALWGCGVDNAVVELSAPEPPAMDGSARAFVEKIEAAGIETQEAERHFLQVDEPVLWHDDAGENRIAVVAHPGFKITYSLNYSHPMIGAQSFDCGITREKFRDRIAPARTFALSDEVEKLLTEGLGKGGSVENAVIYYENTTSSPLRFENEAARHKVLDIVGDFALLGKRLKGHVIAERTGHKQNHIMLKKLEAYRKKS